MLRDWIMVPGMLPKEKCADIIERCRSLPTDTAKIGTGEPTTNQGIDFSQRRTKIAWVPIPGFEDLYQFINSYTKRINRDAYGFDISHGISDVQFTIYDSKQLAHYDWHQDVFYVSNEMFHRKLSIVIQLSDPSEYNGGEFEFRDVEQPGEDFKTQGSVLVFPSFHFHKVHEVSAGTRYSLVAWVDGVKWK